MISYVMDYLAMIFLFLIPSCCARLNLGNFVGVVVIGVLSLHYSIHHVSPEHKTLLPVAVHLKQDPALSQVSVMSCYACNLLIGLTKYTLALKICKLVHKYKGTWLVNNMLPLSYTLTILLSGGFVRCCGVVQPCLLGLLRWAAHLIRD